MQIVYQIAEQLGNIPAEIVIIILSTLPIGELRGALPIALTIYDMPIAKAIFLSILGNILPVYFLLIFFEKGSKYARKHSEYADKLLDKLFERTRRKLETKVQKYGPWALTLFVAIPLPVTGAWTGTLAAFVFGLPKKKSFFAILAGLCIASIIVTIITLGAVATIKTIF